VNRSSRLLCALLLPALAAIAAGCGEVRPLATLDIPPTPPPTTKPGELAAKAFFDRVASGKLTYHASLKGDIALMMTKLGVDGALDVVGNDYGEVVTYSFLKPPKVAVSVRVVGPGRWVRVDRGRWEKASASIASNTPFAGLNSSSDVHFVRTEHVGGKDLHHLTMAGGLIVAPELIPADNVTNERVDKTSLELVVDPAGTPLTGTWTLEGEARVSGQLQGVRMTVELIFTNVDSAIVVKAP